MQAIGSDACKIIKVLWRKKKKQFSRFCFGCRSLSQWMHALFIPIKIKFKSTKTTQRQEKIRNMLSFRAHKESRPFLNAPPFFRQKRIREKFTHKPTLYSVGLKDDGITITATTAIFKEPKKKKKKWKPSTRKSKAKWYNKESPPLKKSQRERERAKNAC